MPVNASARSAFEFGLVDLRLFTYRVKSFNLTNESESVVCMELSIHVLRLINSMIPLMPSASCPWFKKVKNISYRPKYVLIKDTEGKFTAPLALYDILGRTRSTSMCCCVLNTTWRRDLKYMDNRACRI